MRKVFIYLLVDPRKPEVVRYVGQTLTPHSRLLQHCCDAGKTPKCQWLELMAREGVMPQMVIVDETTEHEANAQELLWIARFRNTGHLENGYSNPKPEIEPPAAVAAPPIPSQARSLANLGEVERDIIREAIRAASGDKVAAARVLGISLATLYRKLPPKRKP